MLGKAWVIALTLMLVRLGGILLGSYFGGTLARDPAQHNAVSGLAFITQAGVSVGLAKEIGVEFHLWGGELATLSIGVIVLSQIIGPPLLKWVLKFVGESHLRAEPGAFDGVRDAIIFGLEGQSLVLAQQLKSNGWGAKIICNRQEYIENPELDIEVDCVDDFSLETLQRIELGKAEAVVALLSDDENFQICEMACEHFGTKDVIVRLNERSNFERFHELGVLVVDPMTAIVGMLDHLVRSPVAASVLLGMDPDQDIVDVEVRDPLLEGVAIRDIRLPLDTVVISVSRDSQMLVSHGYTRLNLGDQVTVAGSVDGLQEVLRIFDDAPALFD